MDDRAEIEGMLGELAELRRRADVERLQAEERKRRAIPDEVAAALAAVAADAGRRIRLLNDQAEELTAQVKTAVLGLGESIKGGGLHAVYSAGRAKWDDRALVGYAATSPEILGFRSTGKPSVSIRSASDE